VSDKKLVKKIKIIQKMPLSGHAGGKSLIDRFPTHLTQLKTKQKYRRRHKLMSCDNRREIPCLNADKIFIIKKVCEAPQQIADNFFLQLKNAHKLNCDYDMQFADNKFVVMK
jgi:hypothetical protein